MTELQIQYFIETAKCLNITSVANKFFVSQPAVSMQIIDLENELGCTLFYRSKSKIMLTDAGKLFLDYFEKQKERLDECIQAAKQMQLINNDILRLGVLEGWDVEDFMTDKIEQYQNENPQVEIVLQNYGFKGLPAALLSGNIDLALDLNKVKFDSQKFESKKVGQISRVLMYSKKVDKEIKSLADFKDYRFFVISDVEVSSSINTVNRCCEPYGFRPSIHIVPNISSQFLCVQNNMGVAITDEWTETSNSRLRFLKLDDELHDVRLVWRKNAPDFIKRFTDCF